MAKDFRTNVEFNNSVLITGALTASATSASFGNAEFKTDGGGISIYSSAATEGGQINLYGGTSYSSSIIQIDNYAGDMRFLYSNGNALALTMSNSTGAFTINTNLTASAGTTTLGTTNTGVITSTGSHVATVFHANANNTGKNFRVGDDVWIGDINVADTMSIRGLSGASSNGYIRFGSDSNNFGYNGSNLLYGTEVVAMRPQIQYSTASLQNGSTTTFVKPTGMTGISLIAGVLYKYEIGIWYRVLSTNQIFKARLNYPTLTQGTAQTVIGTNTAQVSYLGGDIILTGTQLEISSTTATNSGATQLIQRTDGFILPSANGTFSFDFAPATSSAIVFQNSYMMITPVTAV